MPIYKAPLEDVSFLLNDVFQIDRYDNLPGFSADRIWRAGTAGHAEPGRQRIPDFGEYGVFDVWRPDHGSDGGADRARQARTEVDVRAENGGGTMDRHHESDRAAMRHRSRP